MTRVRQTTPTRGFTLVELLIGMSLALVVMTAVLTSFIYLGRQLVRLTNQQTLESQSRRTLTYFTQDVRLATGISGAPSATALTLILPTNTGATTTVAYTYDSSAGTFTRTPATGTALVLMRNIVASSLTIAYYDERGSPYTTYTDYLTGIKQVALNFNCQLGESYNGTLTKLNKIASARLVLRNRSMQQ